MIFYVRTHMGLGDMILCNAIIRNICNRFEHVATFVKPMYKESIEFMYRDIANLDLIVADESKVDSIFSEVPLQNKICIGFGNIEHLLERYKFDECFYRQVGLSFKRRWEDFHVERDIAVEKKLMDRFNLVPNEYIFIHDDARRGLCLNEELLPKNIRHFRPDDSERNIFSYCTAIENAKQVHVMDSCFKHVADSLNLKNDLFYHTYVRSVRNHNVTNSKHNWKLLL